MIDKSRTAHARSERGTDVDAPTMSEGGVEIVVPENYRLPCDANRALIQRDNGCAGPDARIGEGSCVSLRFAFYGRVSTEDAQDPEASRSWQKRRAIDLITPHGGVLATDYFDVGQSRSLPWKRRPEASRLLADVTV